MDDRIADTLYFDQRISKFNFNDLIVKSHEGTTGARTKAAVCTENVSFAINNIVTTAVCKSFTCYTVYRIKFPVSCAFSTLIY